MRALNFEAVAIQEVPACLVWSLMQGSWPIGAACISREIHFRAYMHIHAVRGIFAAEASSYYC